MRADHSGLEISISTAQNRDNDLVLGLRYLNAILVM